MEEQAGRLCAVCYDTWTEETADLAEVLVAEAGEEVQLEEVRVPVRDEDRRVIQVTWRRKRQEVEPHWD